MKSPFLIVGMGKSGLAAKRLLIQLGVSAADIKTFDTKSKPVDFSKPEDFNGFKPSTLVVSPGVPLKTSWIQNLLSSGCKLTSELDLAAQNITTEKIVGITGSMGKSTTTTLLGVGAESFSTKVFVGGNLGIPLADYMADVLEGKKPRADWVILELSSYQLENAASLKVELGILTALSPNHLERYTSLDEYYSVKWSLKDRCEQAFLLNYDNHEVERWCGPKMDILCGAVTSRDYNFDDARLIGSHNKQNLALAFSASEFLKWPEQSLLAMKNYPGLAHRLEFVSSKNGVQYINDSKATTIESVLAAVESCLPLVSADGILHLFIGGRDKNLPWQDLAKLKAHSKIIYHFFGECGELSQAKANLPGKYEDDLKSLLTGFKAKPGDVVLLSPGGSSLDEFKSFEDRGDFFKIWVNSL